MRDVRCLTRLGLEGCSTRRFREPIHPSYRCGMDVEVNNRRSGSSTRGDMQDIWRSLPYGSAPTLIIAAGAASKTRLDGVVRSYQHQVHRPSPTTPCGTQSKGLTTFVPREHAGDYGIPLTYKSRVVTTVERGLKAWKVGY